MLPDVDAHIGIRQVNLDAPFAILATMEIDIEQAVFFSPGLASAKRVDGYGIDSNALDRFALQGDQQGVALDARVVGQHLFQVDHQAGATPACTMLALRRSPSLIPEWIYPARSPCWQNRTRCAAGY